MNRNNNYSNTTFHVFVEIVRLNYVLYKLNRHEFAEILTHFQKIKKLETVSYLGNTILM